MRIPGDRPLESWIRDLMEHGRLYAFYQSDDWQELRDAVLLDHNYECEMCAAEGRYGRADTVHHEHEVRREPSMALTRFVTTDDGESARCFIPFATIITTWFTSARTQSCGNKGHKARTSARTYAKRSGRHPPYPIWGQFGGYLQR